MLDPKLLRTSVDELAQNLIKRGFQLDSALITSLEESRKKLQVKVQEMQSKRNSLSKEIGVLKNQGEDCELQLDQVNEISGELKKIEMELVSIQNKLNEYYLTIPNILDDSVPIGKDESENVFMRSLGEIPQFDFEPKEHLELDSSKELMDFALAANLTGSRFVVLHKQLARLHRALIQFMMDVHTLEHGYQEIYVPFMVNSHTMQNSGQLSKFADDLFNLGDTDYYLIPTAEVPVTNIVANRILEIKDLPLKFVCHTPCFRKEAGSYGKDTTGMIRQHQFEKVEMVCISEPDKSDDMLDELTKNAETILQKLKLPYRVMSLCSGDIGFAARKTYDIEVWLPGQNRYREISSCSNCGDFQARRMQARFRSGSKSKLVHTLNGSGLAVGRTLIAILENYQLSNGNVKIPDVLLRYLEPLTEINVE